MTTLDSLVERIAEDVEAQWVADNIAHGRRRAAENALRGVKFAEEHPAPHRRDYYTLFLKARALTEAAHLVGKIPAYPEMADLRAEYIARAEECLAELMEAVNG